MAEVMERTKLREVVLQPFTVLVDQKRNCDVLLQSIPGCRLRSAISASKPVIDNKTGEPRIPADQARCLGELPPTPGMQLVVNPEKLSYEVVDPLYENEDLCERLRSAINRSEHIAVRITGKLRGAKPLRGKLDPHRMKTLCREVVWLLDDNDMQMVTGPRPTLEDVDKLPGNYLLNPGTQVHTTQPLFEKDWAAWVEKLTTSGG